MQTHPAKKRMRKFPLIFFILFVEHDLHHQLTATDALVDETTDVSDTHTNKKFLFLRSKTSKLISLIAIKKARMTKEEIA